MPASLPGDDAPLRRARQRRTPAASSLEATPDDLTPPTAVSSPMVVSTVAETADASATAETAPTAASRSERRSRRIVSTEAPAVESVAAASVAARAEGRRSRRVVSAESVATDDSTDVVNAWMGMHADSATGAAPTAADPSSTPGRRARRPRAAVVSTDVAAASVDDAASTTPAVASEASTRTRRSRRVERPGADAPLLTLEPRVTLEAAPVSANPSDLVVATEADAASPSFSIVQDDPSDLAEHNAIPDEREAVSVMVEDVPVEAVLATVSPSIVLDPEVAGGSIDAFGSDPIDVADTISVAAVGHLSEQAERPVFVPRTVIDPPAASPEPIAASSVSSAPARRRRAGRVAAKSFSFAAFTVAGLLTLATSLPANALLSADDVAAQKVLVTQGETGSTGQTQSVAASGSTALETVQRDSYDAMSAIDAAKALGIQPEATFTNDPNGTIQWPFAVGVHIGSGYGARPGCSIGCSTNHKGQDFNPGYGAPIQSIADGVVIESSDSGGAFGVKIVIEHVIDGQVIHSLYGHMIQGSRTVEVGDPVTVGQVIGQTGNTGRSTGPHLHFEILLNGTDNVDPLAWLYANTN